MRDVSDLRSYDSKAASEGAALKAPLTDLTESIEKARSALSRATRKEGRKVATAADASFLYVWNLSE
ncbi:MAG: hypothetical protein WA660_00025 [Candidatus Acidiferrales bacterium]